MYVLITYDVSTETSAGRKRLRRVAQTCKDFGQRVQKSVFECAVNDMQYEMLLQRLLTIIKEEEDSLRIYRLTEPKESHIETYGVDRKVDFDGPLLA